MNSTWAMLGVFIVLLIGVLSFPVIRIAQLQDRMDRLKAEAIEAGAAAYVCDPATGVVRWEWRKCK